MDDKQEAFFAFTIPGIALLCIISGALGDGIKWLDPHMMALPSMFWFVPEWSLWFYKIPALVLGLVSGITYVLAIIGLVVMFLKVVTSTNFFWGIIKFYLYLFMIIGALMAISHLLGGGKK